MLDYAGDVTIQADQRMILATALADIKPLDRQLFVMYHVHGYTYDELATIMNRCKERVRQRIARTSYRLRRFMHANRIYDMNAFVGVGGVQKSPVQRFTPIFEQALSTRTDIDIWRLFRGVESARMTKISPRSVRIDLVGLSSHYHIRDVIRSQIQSWAQSYGVFAEVNLQIDPPS